MENTTSTGLTLSELNAEEAQKYMGGTILVSTLAILGLIGNLHVLFVYIWRMKPSNHRVFIICLGVLDLITCVVGMPFVVINFIKPFTFYDTTMCKTLTFYNFFICISSACVLIVIAVDRYRKICVPHGKQMSQTMAKAMCIVAMMAALLFSWPGFAIYGSTPIQTRDPFITGYECNLLVEIKLTWYPIIFNGALLFIAFSSFIVLTVLYSIIGKVVWKHRKLRTRGDEINKTEVTEVKTSDEHGIPNPNFHSGSSDSFSGVESANSDKKNATSQNSPRRDSNVSKDKIELRTRTSSVSKETKRPKSTLQRALDKFDRTKRTTFMLFLITLFFFFSYVPYLVLRIAFYTNPAWYPNMTFSGKVAFNTFLWFVYVNNMANPIIYGFCDQRFRNEVRNCYNSLCLRNR